ncbi:hypothetical protein, partial [Cryobacterium frigoriphilum]|uniref:hypothetical protein n=1 Tax=Cryobacterium frigoriphilum TaxID=1259150 RepID=UPI001A7EB31D
VTLAPLAARPVTAPPAWVAAPPAWVAAPPAWVANSGDPRLPGHAARGIQRSSVNPATDLLN